MAVLVEASQVTSWRIQPWFTRSERAEAGSLLAEVVFGTERITRFAKLSEVSLSKQTVHLPNDFRKPLMSP
jgi:hypothetical protein